MQKNVPQNYEKAFGVSIEVRFSDMDPLGHVNNAIYLTYMEQCRVKWFEAVSLATPALNTRVPMIVARIEGNYLAPVASLRPLDCLCWVGRIGNKSYDVCYLFKQEGQEKFRGVSTIVCYDYETQSSIPIWPEFGKELQRYLIET